VEERCWNDLARSLLLGVKADGSLFLWHKLTSGQRGKPICHWLTRTCG